MSLTILQRTTTQAITANTWTAVSWSSAIIDTPAAWSSGSTITVPSDAAGVEVLIYSAWDQTLTANARSRFSINGTVQEYHSYKVFDRAPSHHPTRKYAVSGGNTLLIEIWHDSGNSPVNFYDSLAGLTPYVQFRWWT